ncbi:MAG: ribonuclease III [Elusimicrobia bacterium]|nr:ribonuclease III [Elusimicrobiota bacterium]
MAVLKPLEDLTGYRFKNPDLLKEALSHKSFASESKSGIYNERLEFLGDSILAAVVAHQLYEAYPRDDEGSLSKKKAMLVSRPSLAHWAAELELGSYLFLGVGEENSGGRVRQSLLSNALEALIGAIYLDGGYPAAERFIRRWCSVRHGNLEETDYKSRLQEVLQKKFKVPPSYETTEAEGPDHDKTFRVAVRLGKKALGKGEGKTKKEAEQAAARDALDAMSIPED